VAVGISFILTTFLINGLAKFVGTVKKLRVSTLENKILPEMVATLPTTKKLDTTTATGFMIIRDRSLETIAA